MKPISAIVLMLLLSTSLLSAVDPQLDNSVMTAEHNRVRDLINAGTFHGQPKPASPLLPYRNSPMLNDSAQSVADTCVFAHSGKPGVGENLYVTGISPAAIPPAKQLVNWTAKQVVELSWGAEAGDYTYSSNHCRAGKMCGHYTQIAWAQATNPMVGCGAAQCPASAVGPFGPAFDWVLVVCQYSPAGNYMGERPY